MANDTSFFDTVKEKVDLEDYLVKHLNVDLFPAGVGKQTSVCPFHEEDTPSFILYDDGDSAYKHWYCFGGCQEGGTVIDAVLKGEDSVTDPYEAAEYLNELYDLGLDGNSEAYQRFRKTIEETSADRDRTRAEMEKKDSKIAAMARQYLHNRGYTDETIDHFELGVDLEFTKAGRLAIPLFDKAGHPISIANRALFDKAPCRSCGEQVAAKDMVKRRSQHDKAERKGESTPFEEPWDACPHCKAPASEARVAWLVGQHPKYRESRDFDKGKVLYHEFWSRGPLIKDQEVRGLYLCEGFADVWAGWQAGMQAICSYNGGALTDQQARKASELAKKADKPIILIPDFDETGQGRLNAGSGVDANIRKLRAVDPTVEVQVVYGFDKLDPPCKDVGEVLQHHGVGEVRKQLTENTMPGTEWQIRGILDSVNPITGQPLHSKPKEMSLIAELLSDVATKESLDHLVPVLAKHWNIHENQARNFFYSNLSADESVSMQHLFTTIEEAQADAKEFLLDTNVIPLGFKELDECLPGGGARPGQLMMVLGKSGTGKTMLASQMLANMNDMGINALFLSLEQRSGSFFPRLACQALDRSMDEVNELITTDHEDLGKVRELYENMIIVDNVPSETQEAVTMSPPRIQSIISEANLTHFEGKPVDVVIIDHLGILEPGESAPRDVQGNEMAQSGYIMAQLFAVCKAVNVFMIVLQQLPKEIPPGMPFSYDAGRGGSKQTDSCDYILQIHRPEQRADLDETEKAEVEGQYKLTLGKNRYGASTMGHYLFDKTSLRILPPLKIAQPNPDGEGGIDLDSDAAMFEQDTPTVVTAGDAGATAAGMAALEREHPDSSPTDTTELLRAIGAEEETDHSDVPFGEDSADDLFNIS